MQGISINSVVRGVAVLMTLGAVIVFGYRGNDAAQQVLIWLLPLCVGAYIHNVGARAGMSAAASLSVVAPKVAKDEVA
jgi:hypothetical protein